MNEPVSMRGSRKVTDPHDVCLGLWVPILSMEKHYSRGGPHSDSLPYSLELQIPILLSSQQSPIKKGVRQGLSARTQVD